MTTVTWRPYTTVTVGQPLPEEVTVISTTIGTPGADGPAGPTGPTGPAGVDGGSETHDFTGSPATTHQITHALGYRPNVTVTVAGVTVVAEIEYVNATRIDIRTKSATEPIVYLS